MLNKINPVRNPPSRQPRDGGSRLGRLISNGIKLIIGLGNPGKEYENTYHNVGFLFIDCLWEHNREHNANVANHDANYANRSHHSRWRSDNSHYALKSDVYMNESGRFVAKASKKAGLKPDQLLIVHDDSDIELGKFKISFGRGSAGHKGVAHVIRALKTKDFWRLRIGVRATAEPRGSKRGLTRKKAAEFVLRKISSAHQKIILETFRNIANKLQELLV